MVMVKQAIGVALLAFSVSSFAATTTWNFNATNAPLTDNSNGNLIKMTADGITMTLTAWSETINDPSFCNNGANSANPACNTNGDKYDTNRDPYIDQARLAYYQNGENLGIINKDEPSGNSQHSIDNMPNVTSQGYNDYDMVLAEFSSLVSLTSLFSGWEANSRGADVTILAYTGSAHGNDAFSPSSNSHTTWYDLLSQGWSLVDNYAGVKNNYAISTPVESTHWLIGAYNPVFSGGELGFDVGNDGFKLGALSANKVSTNTTSVPEPGSLALLSLGCLLLFRARAKK